MSNNEGGMPPTASFEVLDISDPSAPRRLGGLSDAGGYDICLQDSLAFVSGWQQPYGEFCIIDISDSAHPRKLGTYATPGDNWGGWGSLALRRAFIADWRRGLCALDITNLTSPAPETTMLVADQAEDIFVDGTLAYVADYGGGLRILDISDPSRPTELGGLDSVNVVSEAVAAHDSFAFIGWGQPPYLRSIDVSDPTSPRKAGACTVFDPPKDMVVRDSFLYAAQAYRFQVLNVARPRQPVLVGSCTLGGEPANLWLTDTLAFASRYIINAADPTRPTLVGTLPAYTIAVAVRDSWVFAPALFDSMVVYAMTNPTAPRKVASLVLSGGHIWNSGAELVDTLFYVGGDILHVVNVADPLNPTEVAAWTPPRKMPRVEYAAPYLYASCWEAGICILDTALTGVAESPGHQRPTGHLTVTPSLTSGRISVSAQAPACHDVAASVFSAAGTRLLRVPLKLGPGGSIAGQQLDLSSLPAGVYLVSIADHRGVLTAKVVRTNGR
jgi:hypothetical protein